MQGRISHHVTSEDTTVSRCLEHHFRLQPDQINDLLKLGAIYSNKRRILEDRALPKGTYLRLHLQPKRFRVQQIDWKSRVVHENKEFMVVNKPSCVPVHASLDNQEENVLTQMRKATGLNLLVTQRLDIPVSGLLVFAKTPEFQRRYNTWLSEKKIHKVYEALTAKAPTAGFHVHYMEQSERSPKKVVAEEKPKWLRCELTIESVTETEKGFVSRLYLHTGRTHQIRAQLGAMGCSILGDALYGSQSRYIPGQIALFACRLEIPVVGGPKACFELPSPWGKTCQESEPSQVSSPKPA